VTAAEESDDDVRYTTTVTAVGALVPDFAAQGVVILFGEGAPEELHEFSVLHRASTVRGGVSPGDVVIIDDFSAPVLAVGSVVHDNLVQLGHLDLKADGRTTAALPGDVSIAQGPLPVIRPGSTVQIRAGVPTSPDPEVVL
jgi:PTS system glucitol/sorbitol-specific IIA component